MRVATVVLAACAVSFAAADSSADDAPAKPAAPKPLRLAMEKGKTYLYRLSETITTRLAADKIVDVDIERRIEVVWDAGLSLQRVEENGNFVVSLMTERVRGSSTEWLAESKPDSFDIEEPRAKQPDAFDSEDPNTPVRSPLLRRGLRVTLSPTGRVLEVAGQPSSIPDFAANDAVGQRVVKLEAMIAKAFAQQFFHELPDAAPRPGLAWDQTRALAPRWSFRDGEVTGDALADAEEKSTVQRLSPDTVTAGLRARGRQEVKRTDVPVEHERVILEPQGIGFSTEQVEDWLVLGDVRLRRDNGLVDLRTVTTMLNTHVNPVRIPKEDIQPIPTLPVTDLVSDGHDCTYEITTRLELVDVR